MIEQMSKGIMSDYVYCHTLEQTSSTYKIKKPILRQTGLIIEVTQ